MMNKPSSVNQLSQQSQQAYYGQQSSNNLPNSMNSMQQVPNPAVNYAQWDPQSPMMVPLNTPAKQVNSPAAFSNRMDPMSSPAAYLQGPNATTCPNPPGQMNNVAAPFPQQPGPPGQMNSVAAPIPYQPGTMDSAASFSSQPGQMNSTPVSSNQPRQMNVAAAYSMPLAPANNAATAPSGQINSVDTFQPGIMGSTPYSFNPPPMNSPTAYSNPTVSNAAAFSNQPGHIYSLNSYSNQLRQDNSAAAFTHAPGQMSNAAAYSNLPDPNVAAYSPKSNAFPNQMGQNSVASPLDTASLGRTSWPDGYPNSTWQQKQQADSGLKVVNLEEAANVWEFESGIEYADPVLQCTFERFPQTNSILSKSRLPLGIIVQPFARLDQEPPLIKRDTIVRCKSCRTYLNPYVSVVRRYQWRCNICHYLNEVPPAIISGLGEDQSCPELQHQTVEHLASAEYMVRPPIPAVYVFVMEVSFAAVSSGYLKLLCDRIIANIENIPSDSRTLISLICYDEHLHFFVVDKVSKEFNRAIITDLSEFFLPSPANALLVKLQKRKEQLIQLLQQIPEIFAADGNERHSQSCLGYALRSAMLMIKPTGGRITAFVCQSPTCGPGRLSVSEKSESFSLTSDFYKEAALECAETHISIDMFVLSSVKTDLFTLYSLPKNCAGEINYIPNFSASSPSMAEKFTRHIDRYLRRPVGFEAVMRIRCTRGITLYTYHGNFFVRTTDLLALPVVNVDAAYGIEMQIEEDLNRDVEYVYIQTAVLYTNHMAERRIRVHTSCLPVSRTINELYQSANLKAIVCLVSRMAVSKAMSDNRELARSGMTNVALDVIKAFSSLFCPHKSPSTSPIYLPPSICALPACMSALMKSVGFNTDPSVTEDQRSFYLAQCNIFPVADLMRLVYPPLYNFLDILRLVTSVPTEQSNLEIFQSINQLPLSENSLLSTDLYILHTYDVLYIYLRDELHSTILNSLFGVQNIDELPLDMVGKFQGNDWISTTLVSFLKYICDDLTIQPSIVIIRDKDKKSIRREIHCYMYDDRSPSSFSLPEFYKYIKSKL